jgi:hypothetical protein
MVTNTTLKALVLGSILALTGCAGTGPDLSRSDSTGATHYWESTASTKKYNADHAACEQQTRVDAEGQLDPDSTSFGAYRDCMIKQGYSLRTY